MTRLALFDLDDTLVDRSGAFRRWAEEFVLRHELEHALPRLIELDNGGHRSRRDVFAALNAEFNTDFEIEAEVQAYREAYFEFYEPNLVVSAALIRLRAADWKIGLVTNGYADQRIKVDRAELGELIDGICIAGEFGAFKPDPGPLLEAARRCGADAAEVRWMVGDNFVADIGGAVNAGFASIWLSHGRDVPEGLVPDVVVGNVLDAIDFLLTLPSEG